MILYFNEVCYRSYDILLNLIYTDAMSKKFPTQNTSSRAVSNLLTYAGVWFAVIAWGTSFVAARFLLHPQTAGQAFLSPTVLAALRFSIASLFFVIPLARAIIYRQVSARDLLLMAFLGQVTFSLYFWLQYTGVQETNASVSSILVVGLIPIATAILSPLLGKEHLNLSAFGGFLLGFCGITLIVLQNQLVII